MIEWWPLRAADLTEVADFTCAEPPSAAEAHLDPDEWSNSHELEAQVGLQNIQFPLPRGERVLVGRDSTGVMAALCWWIELGRGRFKILGAAVALTHRGLTPRVGKLLIDEVIDRLLSDADGAGVEVVSVYGLVRPKNGNSQRMLHNAGFFYVQDDSGFQEWWARLEVPSVDD